MQIPRGFDVLMWRTFVANGVTTWGHNWNTDFY